MKIELMNEFRTLRFLSILNDCSRDSGVLKQDTTCIRFVHETIPKTNF